MTIVPNDQLVSLHGRRLGINSHGRLVSQSRDAIYAAMRYVNVAASTAISNSNTETAFDTNYTLKKNSLQAGSVIRVKYQGIATSTHSTDTLAIKFYLGGLSGTALMTGTATDVANNAAFWGEVDIIIRTIGGSGTFVARGVQSIVPAATAVAVPVYTLTASTAIDTTADQVLTASATWSVADATNSCRMDFFTVDEV